MKIVLVSHALSSCWNHGNAHFLRGLARELLRRGHAVDALEPACAWSKVNLVQDQGPASGECWREAYPELPCTSFDEYAPGPALDAALDGAELVLVHEWSEPSLVRELARRRHRGGRFLLLFHDTHHRVVTSPSTLGPALIEGYDGLLAFGASLLERWRAAGWAGPSLVWHEAADTSLFRPLGPVRAPGGRPQLRDLVWIGNWGDDERAAELRRFLIEPVRRLALDARVHGVRWPASALGDLAAAGIEHAGWIANHRVPRAFAAARMTVHVPRRAYVEALPGIPTIRVFEALACGIPLVCAPWDDAEGLFPEGCWLEARDGEAMASRLRALRLDADLRASLVARGSAAIEGRHTMRHRGDELLGFVTGLRPSAPAPDRLGAAA